MDKITEQIDFSVSMEPIIRMCTSDIQTSIEQEILKACYRIGVDVDKDRLMQALTDARKFFNEGYRAGYEAGFEAHRKKMFGSWPEEVI